MLPAGQVRLLPVAAGQPHEELHARVARRVLKGGDSGVIINSSSEQSIMVFQSCGGKVVIY